MADERTPFPAMRTSKIGFVGKEEELAVILTLIGSVVILAALQDLFHTIFHPTASGGISDWLELQVWRAFRRTGYIGLNFAGPMGFVLVVTYWSSSILVGFALIYWPRLPASFVFASGLDPGHYASFAGALNISLGSLITTSTGVYASSISIQFLMGVEAVFGFAILSASISWILSIYPVLEHRRSLAHEATLLHFAEERGIKRLEDVSDSDLQQILLGLASQLLTHRNELTQFPITYFFRENDDATALAGVLPYLTDIAEMSLKREGAARAAAAILGGAIDDYLKVIASSFLKRRFSERRDALRAFARDQKRTMVRAPASGRGGFQIHKGPDQ
jgi:hypothetical protein